MTSVKRIEIVCDVVELKHVTDVLDRVGASGYTVLHEVTGKGGRGIRGGDQLANVLKNCYVLSAVPEELVEPIAKAVRPILKRFGGICLVSDAQSIAH